MQCTTNKAIIFDFDFTLAVIPSSDEERMRIINAYKKEFSEEVVMNKMKNANSDYELIDGLFTNANEVTEVYCRVLELNQKLANYAYVLPSVCEMLCQLSKYYSLFVYSGRDIESLKIALKKNNILMYFKEVRGSNAHEAAKPNPNVLNSILKNNSLNREHVIYVGDKQVDKDLSTSAKCDFVHAKWYRRYSIHDVEGCNSPEEAILEIANIFEQKTLTSTGYLK